MTTENVDVITIRIHLNELKSQFDRAMLEGKEFAFMKKMYMEIKELECHLNVMEWEADKRRIERHFTRPHYPFL
jgi:hypothetical protein